MTIGVKAGGREFTLQDGCNQPNVAILNATAARLLSPGGDPIGRRFRVPDFDFYDQRSNSTDEPGTSRARRPGTAPGFGGMYAIMTQTVIRRRHEPRSCSVSWPWERRIGLPAEALPRIQWSSCAANDRGRLDMTYEQLCVLWPLPKPQS
jgi:hypothetical protein